jgi:hypothetical protein
LVLDAAGKPAANTFSAALLKDPNPDRLFRSIDILETIGTKVEVAAIEWLFD